VGTPTVVRRLLALLNQEWRPRRLVLTGAIQAQMQRADRDVSFRGTAPFQVPADWMECRRLDRITTPSFLRFVALTGDTALSDLAALDLRLRVTAPLLLASTSH